MKDLKWYLMPLGMRLPFLWHNRIYENNCFIIFIIITVVGMYRGLYDLPSCIA